MDKEAATAKLAILETEVRGDADREVVVGWLSAPASGPGYECQTRYCHLLAGMTNMEAVSGCLLPALPLSPFPSATAGVQACCGRGPTFPEFTALSPVRDVNVNGLGNIKGVPND